MSNNRPAADRIRPILAAMERSIDAARRRRTVQDQDDEQRSSRPMAFGDSRHSMLRPEGAHAPAAHGSSPSALIGHSEAPASSSPTRPMSSPDPSTEKRPHGYGQPLEGPMIDRELDQDDDDMPRRIKARPKRSSTFFNSDDGSLHSRAG